MARMHIDRAFKGALGRTIELYDNGMCDGPVLEIGKQYLMYTSGPAGGPVPARGCTRSRGVEYAEEDLAFLDQYSKGKITTHINGTVTLQKDVVPDREPEADGETLKDVQVTVSGGGKQFHSTTNSLGRYWFSGLPAGQYAIEVDLRGYRADRTHDRLELATNGCIEANLSMKVDRRLEGQVQDSDGAPVSGVVVEMVSTNQQLKRWEQPVLLGISDEQGRYVIDGIPPGDYYLGANINSTPTKEHPFPKMYYPDTPDMRQAIAIGIGIKPSVHEFNLQVSRKLPLVTIHGKIRYADGSPPAAADRPAVRIKEPGLFGQIEQDEIKIDDQGQFDFVLCDGIRFSAFAIVAHAGSFTYSAPVEFIAGSEDPRLLLILNKSPEEFRKLRIEMGGRQP